MYDVMFFCILLLFREAFWIFFQLFWLFDWQTVLVGAPGFSRLRFVLWAIQCSRISSIGALFRASKMCCYTQKLVPIHTTRSLVDPFKLFVHRFVVMPATHFM